MLNKYWKKQEEAVNDGGMLASADAWALFDYIRDLEMAIRQTMNEPVAPHRWVTIGRMLDSGPKEPE